ncbi:hypothetical protein [Pseudomonas soli]|uniref:hypothetical protein n=1 Tax=Pseudomonas soli TaxID=1306993 RepID=UPI0028A5F960|nr:hypothetical protein [Pseudomonas soli]
MDVDSFYQCLSFIEVAAKNGGEINKFLPVVGTLLGTTVGFGLNQLMSWLKDGKARKNKRDCCYEDCQELKHVCEEAIRQMSVFAGSLVEKVRPTSHFLQASVTLPLLDKYYPDIAHTFSVDQRYWIKIIQRLVNEINEGLGLLLASDDEKSLFRISKYVINLEVALTEAHKLCAYFDKGAAFSDYVGERIYEELGVNRELVLALEMLRDNAARNNTILGLPS